MQGSYIGSAISCDHSVKFFSFPFPQPSTERIRILVTYNLYREYGKLTMGSCVKTFSPSIGRPQGLTVRPVQLTSYSGIFCM